MKLGSWLLVIAAASVMVAQASVLQKRSVFRARLPEPCFTCKAEDRPFAYPLISFFNKMKDTLVRGFTVLKDTVKDKIGPEKNLMQEIQGLFKS